MGSKTKFIKIKRQTLSKEYGFIDYHYSIDKQYPNGILLFLGSFVEADHRGKGLFKEMVNELFNLFPKGTEVQVALSNKKLIHFFKDELKFKDTNRVEYWGSPENAVTLKTNL